MLQTLISIITARLAILSISTCISIGIVLVLTGAIPTDHIVKIFNLSPEAANALKLIVSRFQEVTQNVIAIFNQIIGSNSTDSGSSNLQNVINNAIDNASNAANTPPNPTPSSNPSSN